MSLYLFTYKNNAAVIDVPKGASADRWGEMKAAFATACRHRPRKMFDWDDWVGSFRLYPDQYRNGVFWDEQLANRDGLSVVLFPMPWAEPDAPKNVAAYIRHQRDVVKLSTMTLKWLPMGLVDGQVEPSTAIPHHDSRIDADLQT